MGCLVPNNKDSERGKRSWSPSSPGRFRDSNDEFGDEVIKSMDLESFTSEYSEPPFPRAFELFGKVRISVGISQMNWAYFG